MANSYFLGQGVTVRCEFAVNGVFTDPTTVTLTVQKPDRTETTYTYGAGEITKDSLGHFSKQIEPATLGTYIYKWKGTGACIAAFEYYFQVITYIGA